MDIKFNFLINSITTLNRSNIDNFDEIERMYDFILTLDNNTIFNYSKTRTLLIFENDLLLYIDIINKLIHIYEKYEEYEKCSKLFEKKTIINIS